MNDELILCMESMLKAHCTMVDQLQALEKCMTILYEQNSFILKTLLTHTQESTNKQQMYSVNETGKVVPFPTDTVKVRGEDRDTQEFIDRTLPEGLID